MLQEDLDDAAKIIQNILTEPLQLPGMKEPISLLSAAQSFGVNPEDLQKVMQSFLDYPESTNLLLTELQLLAKDLNAK